MGVILKKANENDALLETWRSQLSDHDLAFGLIPPQGAEMTLLFAKVLHSGRLILLGRWRNPVRPQLRN